MTPSTVVGLGFEHRRDGIGLGTAQPRLSWRTETAVPGWRQSAYEIVVVGADGEDVWSSGRVASDRSVLVPWGGPPLASRQRGTARVRVWGSDGTVSGWSEPAQLEVGLLSADDWTARFVTPDWDDDASAPRPCPLLRREFTVTQPVERARLYLSALGVYEAHLNGVVVGDHVLAPGWTSYRHRLRYETFDVTALVRTGSNAIGALLGDGWYRGFLMDSTGGRRRNLYGDRLALLAQLELTHPDGSAEIVVTDGTWKAATGPTRAADLYDGETYDARLERRGWSAPGHDDADWSGVRVLRRGAGTLVARTGPPVRRTELVRPVQITTSPSGRTIVDFGQNLVGRLRLTVQGPAGTTVTLRHAEVLEGGELCTAPLREAAATDRYTLRGGDHEAWEPRFTFHGFRYAEVDGWPGELGRDDVTAVVCHSDMERTGWFECSDDLVSRLHENAVWGMRGNFLDVPTDCPQRSERLGWTGDIQAFAPTACFLYHAAGFLGSWLADLAVEQDDSGTVPFVVPDTMGSAVATAAWGDAATVVPWTLYERYGDESVLEAQYDSMRAWVDCVAALAGESRRWDQGFQFGDWLDPNAPPDRPSDCRTDRYLIATAYLARSADLVAEAAEVLGRAEDARRYASLAQEVRDSFRAEYVTPNGRLASETQTAYALVLQFGLLRDPEQRRRAGTRLADLVLAADYHIATGFVGTPFVCDALTDAGETESAYRLLLQRGCPSWLYPVTMGATTIWERWDSLRPDGSVNPARMNSFNHYAYGAVADWLHRSVGGLALAEPGYRRITIRPRPGGGLTWARSRHRTPYGIAESAWEVDGAAIEVTATVPPNTAATVHLPGREDEPIEVGAGEHHWRYELPPADDGE